MTKKCPIGILILAWLTMTGCQTESEQMKDLANRTADLANRSVESQNDVNAAVAKSNENVVHLHQEIQRERSDIQKERFGLQTRREFLDHQFESLDQHRRDLHQERKSELAWSESFQFLALVLVTAMPLLLCAFLIWAASRKSVEQEEVNAILLREFTSAEPRWITAQNLPAIEDRSREQERNNEETSNERKLMEKK